MIPGPRITCCVPFCKRTIAKERLDPNTEWVCQIHWKNVPKAARRLLTFTYRRYKRHFGDNRFWHYPGGSKPRLACLAAERANLAAWEECKRLAIEGAAGI